MAISSTRRSKAKRKSTFDKTFDQNGQLYTNIKWRNDYEHPFPFFKNDYYNCRIEREGVRDSNGWPTSDDWVRIVLTDARWNAPTTNVLLPENQYIWNVEGINKTAGGRYAPLPYTKICRVKTRNSADAFPFASSSTDMTITDAFQDPGDLTTWFFKLNITGNVPIMIPNPGSNGFYDLVMPGRGFELEDIDNQMSTPEGIYNPLILTEYATHRGFRTMGLSNINAAPLGGGYKMLQQITGDRGVWAQRRVFGVNEPSPSPRDYTDRFGYWVNPIINIEVIVDFMNRIKAMPGSRLQKVWFCFPAEILNVWNKKYYYNTSINPDTGILSEDVEIPPLATCDPMFDPMPPEQDETYMSGGLGAEFVYNTVEYIINNLHPSLEVVFEYSNETWNYSYSQANTVYEAAVATTKDPLLGFNYPNIFLGTVPQETTDVNRLRARMHGYMATKISQIAKTRFALHPERPMCEVYTAGQYVQPFTIYEPFLYARHHFNNFIPEINTKIIDAISPAAYFHPYNYTSKTINDIWNAEITDIATGIPAYRFSPPNYDYDVGYEWIAEFAHANNIKSVIYEGGWDTQVVLNYKNPIGLNSFSDNQYWYPSLLDQTKMDYFMDSAIAKILELGTDEYWSFHATAGRWNWDSYNFHLTSYSLENTIDLQPPLKSWRKLHNNILSAQTMEIGHTISANIGETSIVETKWVSDLNRSALSTTFGLDGNSSWIVSNIYPSSEELLSDSEKASKYSTWKYNTWFTITIYIPTTGTYRVTVNGSSGETGAGDGTSKMDSPIQASTIIDKVPYVSATNLVSGRLYRIVVANDSDFTLVGAGSNNANTLFTATGSTSGSGWCLDVVKTSSDDYLTGGARIVLDSFKLNYENNLGYSNGFTEKARFKLWGWGSTGGTVPAESEYQDIFFERGWHSLKTRYDLPGSFFSSYVDTGKLDYKSVNTTSAAWNITRDNDPSKLTYSTTSISLNANINNLTLMVQAEPGKLFTTNDTVYFRDLTSQKWVDGIYVTSIDNAEYRVFYAYVKSYDNSTGQLEVDNITNVFYALDQNDPVTGEYLPTMSSNNWEIGTCFYVKTTGGLGYTFNPQDHGFNENGFFCNTISLVVDPPAGGGTQAEAVVTAVDGSGKITDFKFTNCGNGYSESVRISVIDNAASSTVTAKFYANPDNSTAILPQNPLLRRYNTKFTSLVNKTYTYAQDQLGGDILDQNGNKIVVTQKENVIQTNIRYYNFTRIS